MSALLGWFLCASLADDPTFIEGQRLYRALEYEQAMVRFEAVAARPALASPDRAQALIWLGLATAGTGDLEAAKRQLQTALSHDASAALPENAPPRVQKMFAELRRARPPDPAPAPDPSVAALPAEPAASVATSAPPALPAPAPADADHTPGLFVPGAVVAGVGAAGLIGGAVLALVAATSFSTATDPDAFQDDAKAALDRANITAIAAGVALPLGAIAGGAGAALIALSLLDE